MRVLAVGMLDRTYPRNRVVLEAMRRRGIGVEVCHVPVWELERDKERGYAGVWNRAKLVARLLYAQFTLLFRWLTHRWDADVIWIGFPGHCDTAGCSRRRASPPGCCGGGTLPRATLPTA